jgi:hypothetical protein
MFWSRNPKSQAKRIRVLASFGRPSGVLILPKPFPGRPPEMVHQHSCLVPMPVPGKIMAVEWTGSVIERHWADVE